MCEVFKKAHETVLKRLLSMFFTEPTVQWGSNKKLFLRNFYLP